MANKSATVAFIEQQQYHTIERALGRAGYDHEAYIEERPRVSHGSLVFSTFNGTDGKAIDNNNNNSIVPPNKGMTASNTFPGAAINPSGSIMANPGYGLSGAASMFGTSVSGGLHHMMSSSLSISGAPSSYFGGSPFISIGQNKRYSQTVRSSASSIISLSRSSKREPPVAVMTHYNSPYEKIFYGQSGSQNFVGREMKLGTICISTRAGQGSMHFLVRTIFKFVHVEIPDSFRATEQFKEYRSLYKKKDDFHPMLHLALKQCLESVPETEVNRHQVYMNTLKGDQSVVVSEPGWVKSPTFIISLINSLEEVKGEGFTQVLKSLEAQMKPSTLMVDLVIPDERESNSCTEAPSYSTALAGGSAGMSIREQERFWNFFKGLGDPVENEIFQPAAAKTQAKTETVQPGTEPEEYLKDAIEELISTERSYNQQLRVFVNIYLDEARKGSKDPLFPISKYEIRTIFFNVEQLLELSTTFLSELAEYEEWSEQQDREDGCHREDGLVINLGNICQRNLAMMGCYKSCLINNKKATDLNRTASKRSGYEEYQSLCMRLAGSTSTLSDLLSNPFQRMARYPMLFKSIINRCRPESEIIPGLQEAINAANQISHMEKSFVDQTGLMLRYLTDKVEHCPRDIFSSNRTILGYLDCFETNLLSGERGKAICLILLSDKVMVVSRPSNSSLGSSSSSSYLSGELLFPAEFDEKGNAKDPLVRPGHSAGGPGAGIAHARKSSIFHSQKWKFRGWTDLLNLKMVCVEQTDPEGLFCMTSTHHQIPQQSKNGSTGRAEDQWEGTRGILPENLDDRDQFITKFNTALAITKAKAAGNSLEWTARLNVAELELVFNVFTESQYREFSKQRGDMALFYTQPAHPTPNSNLNPGVNGSAAKGHGQHLQQQSGQIVDLMSFKRLPLHVGLIQSSSTTAQTISPNVVEAATTTTGGSVGASEESCHADGFRLVLKSKADLNGSGSTTAASEEANRFLDVDAFQIHLTDLVANLQWTIFNFDPYQSAQLHFSRLYMDGPDQYLWNTASAFSRSNHVRAKGAGALKSHRDSVYLASSSPTQCRPLFQHQHGGSISTLSSSSSANIGGMSSPSSPSGSMVGRSLYHSSNGAPAPMSPISFPSRPFSIRRKRTDSVGTVGSVDSADTLSSLRSQPPRPTSMYGQLPQSPLSPEEVGMMKSSVSIMNLWLPGRKTRTVVESRG